MPQLRDGGDVFGDGQGLNARACEGGVANTGQAAFRTEGNGGKGARTDEGVSAELCYVIGDGKGAQRIGIGKRIGRKGFEGFG